MTEEHLMRGECPDENQPDARDSGCVACADTHFAILRRKRSPLAADPKNQHAINVPGFGWVAVKVVRAIERAHGIG